MRTWKFKSVSFPYKDKEGIWCQNIKFHWLYLRWLYTKVAFHIIWYWISPGTSPLEEKK